MPTGQLTPSEQQGGTGAGNAPPVVVRSHMDNSRHISLTLTALRDAMAGGTDALSDDDLEYVQCVYRDSILAAARELLEGIGGTPMPDAPARPPVEPSNRPDKE